MFVPKINGAIAIIGAIILLICRICDADLRKNSFICIKINLLAPYLNSVNRIKQ